MDVRVNFSHIVEISMGHGLTVDSFLIVMFQLVQIILPIQNVKLAICKALARPVRSPVLKTNQILVITT